MEKQHAVVNGGWILVPIPRLVILDGNLSGMIFIILVQIVAPVNRQIKNTILLIESEIPI